MCNIVKVNDVNMYALKHEGCGELEIMGFALFWSLTLGSSHKRIVRTKSFLIDQL